MPAWLVLSNWYWHGIQLLHVVFQFFFVCCYGELAVMYNVNQVRHGSVEARVALSITKHLLKIRRLHILWDLGTETYTRCLWRTSGRLTF